MDKKHKTLVIRLTASEHIALKTFCVKKGITMSEFVIDSLNEKIKECNNGKQKKGE